MTNRVTVFIFIIFLSSNVGAQSFERINAEHSCTFFGELAPDEETVAFVAVSEAVKVIDDIVNESGLARNFEVRSGNVPNASALIQGSTRYIIYNQNFMQSVTNLTNNRWGAISIMAHEVGHHLNAHTLSGGSRPDKEIEADYFSGFILQKMGASLDDAQTAMRKIGSDRGSSTHPAKNQRLSAIAAGWSSSCDKDNNCSVFGKPASSPAPKETTKKFKTTTPSTSLPINDYLRRYVSLDVDHLLIDMDQKFAERMVNIENRGSKGLIIRLYLDIYGGSCDVAPVNMGTISNREVEIEVGPNSSVPWPVTVRGAFIDYPYSCGGFDIVKSKGFYQ